MNSVTLKNLLPTTKIKLKDNVTLLALSLFYNHPSLLAEDGWVLLKVGSEKVLVDNDTMHVFEGEEIKLKWTKDQITGVNLTSSLTGDALTEHWNEKVAYCNDVRNQMKDFFDQDKVDALCDKVKSVKINA